ncbi:MAG: lipocalin-like domain-containing protein [Burkholderiaceae bacterium]
MPTRRHLLLAAGALPLAARAAVDYPAVTPRPLEFPRDHGAHPTYRIEWWYLTGWLDAQPPLGFQVTFFRTRTPIDPANPSRFAAHQLVIAHAAIADAAHGALVHDQRIARAGFGIARAAEADTDVALDRWTLRRASDGTYECAIPARGFALRFRARPTQPILLQGEAGFSRKGPKPEQASYYYSQPQLRVDAELVRDGRRLRAGGIAWLDHEWSSTLLDPAASGWDWIGMNLDDGAALAAFQIRRNDGGPRIHAYAALRAAGHAQARIFAPDEVRFEPLARWTSPRTRATYLVAQRIAIGARTFETRPLLDDQELDSRTTAGAVYWEGASTLLESGRPVGRGYLEMTGYVAPMRL